MSKHGSPSVWILVDGYNLVPTKLKTLGYKIAALQEDTTGVGDATKNAGPIGLSEVSVEMGGGFFDTTTTTGHAALKDIATSPQAASRVVSLGFAGHTLGAGFVGLEGAYSSEYDVIAQVAALTKANAKITTSGVLEHGVILHPLGAVTADGNGAAVDHGASSTNGGAGYFQVTALSGFTSVTVKIQHSADNVAWADLLSFTAVTAAPAKQRVAVAGTVNRYTRRVVTVTGAGSMTFFAGFSRG